MKLLLIISGIATLLGVVFIFSRRSRQPYVTEISPDQLSRGNDNSSGGSNSNPSSESTPIPSVPTQIQRNPKECSDAAEENRLKLKTTEANTGSCSIVERIESP